MLCLTMCHAIKRQQGPLTSSKVNIPKDVFKTLLNIYDGVFLFLAVNYFRK